MSKRILFTFVFLISLPASFAKEDPTLSEQQEIIAVLSGKKPMPDGQMLKSRSREKQRENARTYLAHLITQLELQPQFQHYEMPNLNPVIDLLFDPFQGANVYTVLPATNESDEYVILGAHFDTELDCPGAIDNGSGIAIIYSVLKNLITLKERSKNVIVVFFDQEEEETVGSRYFAQFVKDEGYEVHSMHSLDTIGWDNDGDRAVEVGFPSKYLEDLYKKIGGQLNIPIYITRSVASDDQPFRDQGFDAVGLTDEYVNGDYAPYKDTPKDTYETVNFEYLASCTQLVTGVAKEIVEL